VEAGPEAYGPLVPAAALASEPGDAAEDAPGVER